MIGIGCDHGGFELKEELKIEFNKLNIKYIDYGTNSLESVDYPVIASKLAKDMQNGKINKGILICKSGIGMSIAANKFSGIRCALCEDIETAKSSREHNDSNILALSANKLNKEKAIEIINIWLETNFTEGRHKKRVDLISEIEKNNIK